MSADARRWRSDPGCAYDDPDVAAAAEEEPANAARAAVGLTRSALPYLVWGGAGAMVGAILGLLGGLAVVGVWSLLRTAEPGEREPLVAENPSEPASPDPVAEAPQTDPEPEASPSQPPRRPNRRDEIFAALDADRDGADEGSPQRPSIPPPPEPAPELPPPRNPFGGERLAVALPATSSTTIARLLSWDGEKQVEVRLLERPAGADRSLKYRLTADGSSRMWIEMLEPDRDPLRLAALATDARQLRFAWLSTAGDTPRAGRLRNRGLHLSNGEFESVVQLRPEREVDPLLVEMDQNGIEHRLEAEDLPDGSLIQVHWQGVSGTPLDAGFDPPSGIVPVGQVGGVLFLDRGVPLVGVRLIAERRGANEVRFDLRPVLRNPAGDWRPYKDKDLVAPLALLKQQKAAADYSLKQAERIYKKNSPPLKRAEQAHAQTMIALDTQFRTITQLNATLAALHRSARLHFRLVTPLEGADIVLLRSPAPPPPEEEALPGLADAEQDGG